MQYNTIQYNTDRQLDRKKHTSSDLRAECPPKLSSSSLIEGEGDNTPG